MQETEQDFEQQSLIYIIISKFIVDKGFWLLMPPPPPQKKIKKLTVNREYICIYCNSQLFYFGGGGIGFEEALRPIHLLESRHQESGIVLKRF